MTIPTIQPILSSQSSLDRDSLIPLYHQLYEILRSHISEGIWKPGDMIPPESELKKRYGVSQITVRQSLNILVENGAIYRQRGKGTFVSQPMITSNMTHIVHFAEDMRQRGLQPHTELINANLAPMSKDTAEKLQVDIGEEVALIRRLRYADGEPLSIENSCLVHRYVPDILKNDFSKRSLHETLVNDYDIILSYAEQTIRAKTVSAATAELLGIQEDDAILVIERVSYSQRNIPVEFLRITYRADRYLLHCELRGT